MKMEKKDKIKELRSGAGLTVKELSDLLGFKSESTLKKWESGARIPKDEVMDRIIEICSIDKDKKENEVLEEYKEDEEKEDKEEYKVNKDKEEKKDREENKDKEDSKEIKAPQRIVYNEKFIKRNLQLRESYSEKLNDTAYWDRKTLKDVLDEALTMYFKSREEN